MLVLLSIVYSLPVGSCNNPEGHLFSRISQSQWSPNFVWFSSFCVSLLSPSFELMSVEHLCVSPPRTGLKKYLMEKKKEHLHVAHARVGHKLLGQNVTSLEYRGKTYLPQSFFFFFFFKSHKPGIWTGVLTFYIHSNFLYVFRGRHTNTHTTAWLCLQDNLIHQQHLTLKWAWVTQIVSY